MRRRFKRMFAFALVLTMFIGMPCLEVFASEEVETVDPNVVALDAEFVEVIDEGGISTRATTFSKVTIAIGYSSAGMGLVLVTTTTKTASVIGVKNIEIQQQVWYGWNTVATGSGLEKYNESTIGVSITYANVTKGEYYRVKCVHYANVDGYLEYNNTSTGYLCSY